jgi:hypothetical protein
MRPWARIAVLLALAALAAAPVFAQLTTLQPAPPASSDATSKAEKEKEARIRHQSALRLLDAVLAGRKALGLPQNRIAVGSQALPLLWNYNGTEARALVAEMISDFGEAAARQQEDARENVEQMLRQQRERLLQEIAPSDASLALSFMNATRPYLQFGDSEQEQAEERRLRLEIASQEANHNPADAVRLAEKELQTPGALPTELLNLLTGVAAKDAHAGTQLLHDIIGRVRSTDLASVDNLNFALNLLTSQVNSSNDGVPPDDSVKTLADAVASAALSPDFPPNSLPILQGYMPAFRQLAPVHAQPLSQRVNGFIRIQNPQQNVWEQFNRAQATGDANQILAVAEQASPDIRSNLFQQAAWNFANSGDMQRTREAVQKLSDPFLREQAWQQAIRQAATNAANQGQFTAARQLIQELVPDENRAVMLAQLATSAAAAKQEALALQMLDEATGLLQSRPPNSSTFSAQLEVAQSFAHVKPSGAVPLLERCAAQLEQVLSAASELDGFLPYQHSFDGGELVLENGLLWSSLVRPYADATARLAEADLPQAEILAERLSLPEARLFTELLLAQSALADAGP